MSHTTIGPRRGARVAAAILACGLASVIAVPRSAMAQQAGGRGLTEEQVREIVREELAKSREELMKTLQQHLGQHGGAFVLPPQDGPLLREFFQGQGTPMPSMPGFPSAGGWLGVRVSDGENGALVDEVVDDSPALAAGLQAGDVISRVGDQSIGGATDLTAAISSKAPGTKLKVVVARDGEEKSLSVKLGARPGEAFTFSFPPSGAVPAEPVEPPQEKAPKAKKEKVEKSEKTEKAAKEKTEKTDKAVKAEKSEKSAQEKTEKQAKAKADESASAEHGSGPGFLGVQFEPAEGGEGTVVTEVVGGSPAENAGLQAGDVLLSLNGQAVTSDSLPQVVAELGAGSRVKVKLMRGDEEQTIVLRLGSREEGGMMAEAEESHERAAAAESAPEPPSALRTPSGSHESSASSSDKKPGFLGVETRAIDDDARETLGLEAGQGVLVQRVVEGSAAEKAGLLRNDLIVSVDDHNVGTPDQLGEVVRAAGAGHHSSLVIIRKGHRTNLDVELGGRD